jgi:hypothetical protein
MITARNPDILHLKGVEPGVTLVISEEFDSFNNNPGIAKVAFKRKKTNKLHFILRISGHPSILISFPNNYKMNKTNALF